MARKPNFSDQSCQTEIDKIEEKFESVQEEIKSINLDKLNSSPKEESEQQTKIAQKDIEKSKDIYLKPQRSIPSGQKFNEKFRQRYEFDKQYVQFVAVHKEIIGDNIEMWTRPYGGMNAEYWVIPTNKPVYGPMYL